MAPPISAREEALQLLAKYGIETELLRLFASWLEARERLHAARKFVHWAFRCCVVEGGDLEAWVVQEKLAELEMTEQRKAEPGSWEEMEFGENELVTYLRAEWKEGYNDAER